MIHERLIMLDVWRGFAVIGMLVFHTVIVLNFFELVQVNLFEGYGKTLGEWVRISFLLLVGISLFLSRSHSKSTQGFYFKQMKRAGVLLGCASLITASTFFFAPEQAIFFGILHLIAVSLFFLSPMAHAPRISFLTSLFFLLLAPTVFRIPLSPWVGVPIGSYNPTFNSLDWFPVFPWLGIVALGIAVGPFASRFSELFQDSLKKVLPQLQGIVYLGKNALLIYMVHIPVIAAVVWLGSFLI